MTENEEKTTTETEPPFRPGIVHVWASPDPDEATEPDEMVCCEAAPFRRQRGILVVFHPWSYMTGAPDYDYVCRWCGVTTGRAERRRGTEAVT